MGQTPKSELMTAMKTYRFLKIPQDTLYRYLQRRSIPGSMLGIDWRFVRSDLERWIQDTQLQISGQFLN